MTGVERQSPGGPPAGRPNARRLVAGVSGLGAVVIAGVLVLGAVSRPPGTDPVAVATDMATPGASASSAPTPSVAASGIAATATASAEPAPTPTPTPTVPPEPTPEPTPTPTPTKRPAPTPTPTPRPASTPTPTPDLRVVGDYRCVDLEQAASLIAADGFEVGALVGLPDGFDPGRAPDDDIVIFQDPDPGASRPAGASIGLTLYDAGSYPEETCPPA